MLYNKYVVGWFRRRAFADAQKTSQPRQFFFLYLIKSKHKMTK